MFHLYNTLRMRRLHYVYLKPQHYYNRLLTFFILIGFFLTLTIMRYNVRSLELFLLQFVVMLFLLLFIAVFIEFFYQGEYMSPLEVYDLEQFIKGFLRRTKSSDSFPYEHYVHGYNRKVRSKIKHWFCDSGRWFVLSSLRKVGKNRYEATLIDGHRMFLFYLFRFLGKHAIKKVTILSEQGSFRIVHIR